jgi:hypothetical protein
MVLVLTIAFSHWMLAARAAPAKRTISVHMGGIGIVLDGFNVQPVNEQGNPVDIILLDGTNYAPIRGIAQLLRCDVSWQSETVTVAITSNAKLAGPASQMVFSSEEMKTISVTVDSYKITLDGRELPLKNANGEPVSLFNYQGTIYAPLRALSEAYGFNVDWRGETREVFLRSAPKTSTVKMVTTKTNTLLIISGQEEPEPIPLGVDLTFVATRADGFYSVVWGKKAGLVSAMDCSAPTEKTIS